MKLALKVWSSNPEYSGDIDYAFVALTPDLIRLIDKRVKMAQALRLEDSALQALYFWDYTPEWRSIDCDAGVIDDDEVYELPDDFDLTNYEQQRTECDRMIVEPDGDVLFKCNPKHCDFTVSTAYIPKELLKVGEAT